jgi:tetratricopeptide (TPR) repeat protein
MRAIAFAALLVVFPSLVSAQSVAKAKLLHANKMFDDAKREAVAVVFSDATPSDKADALNLLGTIAVDQSDYEAAIKNWTELVERYPDTSAAKEAQAKLPLARKLTSNAADATDRTATDALGAVLVAGVAPEHPQYGDQAVLEFMNFLTSRGVKTTNLFSGRVSDATQGRVADVSLPNLLARAREVNAASVLYVYIHFKGMENMRVECYASDGKKLWQEKVAASLGASPAGMTEGFLRRMKGKLAKHVGGPCFPVAAASGS